MISVGRINKLQHTVLPLQHLNIGLCFGCHFVREMVRYQGTPGTAMPIADTLPKTAEGCAAAPYQLQFLG